MGTLDNFDEAAQIVQELKGSPAAQSALNSLNSSRGISRAFGKIASLLDTYTLAPLLEDPLPPVSGITTAYLLRSLEGRASCRLSQTSCL